MMRCAHIIRIEAGGNYEEFDRKFTVVDNLPGSEPSVERMEQCEFLVHLV